MGTQEFDYTFDVVVVGTGAAGLATAMGAADDGLTAVLLESTDKWGGSTAMSGGGAWLPNNPLMQRDEVRDSREEALTYLDACVGEVGRASTKERKEAFVDGVEDLVRTAERFGITFARAKDYPDYYPELPGGKIGRAIEVKPFDSKQLGEWWDSLRGAMPIPAMTNDVWLLGRAWSSLSGMVRGAQVVGRAAGGAITGKRLIGIGNAWAGAFCRGVVIERGIPMWLKTPLQELIVTDGRVVGVRAVRGGKAISIGANRGVMLAGGGFESNPEMREKYQGVSGAPSGNPGNVGGPIEAAGTVGAAMELMDDAWWGASLDAPPDGGVSFLVGERSMPHSLMVDSQGRRFANESESYVDLGHHMLEHDEGKGPYWLITDGPYALKYFRTFAMDPRALKAMREAGIIVKGKTLDDLAKAIGVEAATLHGTVQRFNGFARAGIDGDFGRGNSAYDRYYSDPNIHPNPNLAPLERGPFTAYRVVLGDLGTKGGVVTDVFGRALREDGSVIEGLFAAGNNSASVMGRTYPGPGSTIGPAAVFGLISARFMARASG